MGVSMKCPGSVDYMRLIARQQLSLGFFLSCFFHHHPPWHTQDFRSPSGSKAKSLVERNITLFICFQIKRPFAVDTTNEPQQSTPYPLPLPRSEERRVGKECRAWSSP